jgi:hypothetical protein
MNSELDMNSQSLKNLPAPTNDNDAARWIDVYTNTRTWDAPTPGITKKESFVATAGQTVFNLANTYVQAANDLSVYVNGVRQAAYVETTTTSVKLYSL